MTHKYNEYTKLINQADGADYIPYHYQSGTKDGKDQEEEGQATVLSSVFNLSNGAVGAGILALPYAISQCGIVLGPILMLVMAALMSYTLIVICQTQSLYPRAKSYETLVKEALGGKAAWLMAGTIIFQTFGSCTSYMIIIADSFTPLLQNFLHGWSHADWIANRAVATLIISVFFIFPLALQKQMNKLRFSSTLSICCVCYIVFMIVLRSVQSIPDIPENNMTYFSKSETSILTSIPLIVFAFRSHTGMPPIYKEMKDNKNPFRIRLVVFLTLSICGVLYYITGIFGYLKFFSHTDDNILNNFSDKDVLASVARFLLIFVMICHYPVVAYCCRSAIDFLIFGDKPLTNTRHVLETLLLWGCFYGVSIAIPSITVVLGLAGSLPFSEFLFPSLFLHKFHTHIEWPGIKGKKALFISFMYGFVALVITVVCTTSIIYKNWIA